MSDVLNTLNQALPDLFRVIDLTGVLLNGILGGRLARQKRFDAVGFAVLAIMSALGGGILRDVMLDTGPPVALTDPYYLSTALVGAGISFLWRMDGKWTRRGLMVADGVVLGTWAATGTTKALGSGFALVPSILMGIVTAVGGGMIRDVAAGNIPVVFGGNTLYATPALVASLVQAGFFHADLPLIGMLVSTSTGSSFVALAYWRQWQLPAGDWFLSLPKPRRRRRRTRRAWRGEQEDTDTTKG